MSRKDLLIHSTHSILFCIFFYSLIMPFSKRKPIDVSIRIKPILPGSSMTTSFASNPSSRSIEKWIIEKSESFATTVWTTNHSQAKIYDEFMQKQFLPSFNAGLNFTCFLYGQTGEHQYSNMLHSMSQ